MAIFGDGVCSGNSFAGRAASLSKSPASRITGVCVPQGHNQATSAAVNLDMKVHPADLKEGLSLADSRRHLGTAFQGILVSTKVSTARTLWRAAHLQHGLEGMPHATCTGRR